MVVVGDLDHPQPSVARSDGGRVVLHYMLLMLPMLLLLLLLPMLLLLFGN